MLGSSLPPTSLNFLVLVIVLDKTQCVKALGVAMFDRRNTDHGPSVFEEKKLEKPFEKGEGRAGDKKGVDQSISKCGNVGEFQY